MEVGGDSGDAKTGHGGAGVGMTGQGGVKATESGRGVDGIELFCNSKS